MPNAGALSYPRRLTLSSHSSIDWEIIVVDDNSPDGTQEVAKELQGVYGEDRIVRPLRMSLLWTR